MTEPMADYDHTPLAGHPEYHDTRRALDALEQAVGRDDDMGPADFVRAVTEMALTSFMRCWCNRCGLSEEPCWPVAARRDEDVRHGDSGDVLICTYRCPLCGDEWTALWSTIQTVPPARDASVSLHPEHLPKPALPSRRSS